MNATRFLTRRWNIVISAVQGIPTFGFAVVAILTGVADGRGGMIALSVAGSLFCLILELHTSARFAAEWRRTVQDQDDAKKPALAPWSRALLAVHSLAFWFFLIPLFTSMPYRTGFIAFTAILFVRFLANSYINVRDFDAATYYRYPFRIP